MVASKHFNDAIWNNENRAMLGTMSDSNLAARLCLTRSVVSARKRKLGIKTPTSGTGDKNIKRQN